MGDVILNKDLNYTMRQVGGWSYANFGNQMYKTRPGAATAKVGMLLGEAAPLFGVVEEVGELHDALRAKEQGESNPLDIADAIGDIGIYLCDFLYRDGATEFPEAYESERTLVSLTAMLCRTYLKHHQGIRDLADRFVYEQQRSLTIAHMRYALDQVALWHTDSSFIACVQETFANVVSKRDWTEAPADGGGHTHGK